VVSAKEIKLINCPEDKVHLAHTDSGYILSNEAYQAWNVWMEEYTREMLEGIPCKYVKTGIALKPIETVSITSPEEIDLILVFNGKSIAVECMDTKKIFQANSRLCDKRSQ